MTDRFNKSEKSTKHFVKSQFPDFFLDEGEGIVNFVDQYYRHFSDNTGNKIRDLQFQGDIDTTSNANLIRFNNKYTFGSGRAIKELPAVITGDLRFIIKHIKDLYRSKGTSRGIKLFFRLSFNDSPEIFVPGNFLFRPSDSIFRRPDLIEIFLSNGNDFSDLEVLLGTQIFGSRSGSSAIVSNYFKKRVGQKESIYIELDNISGKFVTGDKIVSSRLSSLLEIATAPKVVGPVNDIIVETGLDSIPLGTTFTALTTEFGKELKASVLDTERFFGTFFLRGVSGYGYSANSEVIVTRAIGEDDNIDRGKFSVITSNEFSTHDINGDLLQVNNHEVIGSANINGYIFDSANSLNSYNTTSIRDILSYSSRTYGSIFNISINEAPKNYNGLKNPFVAIKDVSFTAKKSSNVSLSNTLLTVPGSEPIFSNTLLSVSDTFSGNVSIFNANNKVVGVGTSFTDDFASFDVIKVMNDDGLPTFHNIERVDSDTLITLGQSSPYTFEGNDYSRGFVNYIELTDGNGKRVIRTVNNSVNSTAVYLDDKILTGELSSTGTYDIKIGYNTSNANFSPLNDPLKAVVKEGTQFTDIVTGVNADLTFNITSASGSVSKLQILNCGFGYNSDDEITMRSEDLTPKVNITDTTGSGAQAFAIVLNQAVVDVIVTNGGSGYTSPNVTVEGGTGTGATLSATVSGGIISTISVVSGGSGYFATRDINIKVVKGGQSILEGRHATINSEPNSKIRLQDSNFWQEYSYEVESTINNDRYEEVLDQLMHMSGRRFFTKNLIKDETDTDIKVLEESVTASGV